MSKYALASIGTFRGIDKSTGAMIMSKSLTDSALQSSITENLIKGGMLNQNLGAYYTDAELSLSLTDALFDMQYLAMNVGAEIQGEGEVFTIEHKKTATSGSISLSKTPLKLASDVSDIFVWVKEVGTENWIAKVPTVSSSVYTVSGLKNNTEYCVKYLVKNATSEQFTISSSFVPKQIYAEIEFPLFKCSESGAVTGSSAQVGSIFVKIPTLQLDGSIDISMSASGNATTPLKGKALINYEEDDCCGNANGYYAKVTKVINDATIFSDVYEIYVVPEDDELASGEETTIHVYGKTNGGAIREFAIGTSGITVKKGSTEISTSTVTMSTSDITITVEVDATDFTGIAEGCTISYEA